MQRSSAAQQHIRVRRGMPTELAVVPHIAALDDSLQSNREQYKGLNWGSNISRERSVAEHRTHAMQGLAILGEMTGGITHDFRKLLAIIGSSLRFAERHSGEPEKVCPSIAAARDGIGRGLQLTSQLLAFAERRVLPTDAGNANECLKTLKLRLAFTAGPGICIGWSSDATLRCAYWIHRCSMQRSSTSS